MICQRNRGKFNFTRRLGCYTVRVEGSSTTKGHAGGTSGESVSTTRRELISPAELTQWTADTGLLLVTGEGAYAVPCPDLSERFEQGMLGMGTREEDLATRRRTSRRGGGPRSRGSRGTSRHHPSGMATTWKADSRAMATKTSRRASTHWHRERQDRQGRRRPGRMRSHPT